MASTGWYVNLYHSQKQPIFVRLTCCNNQFILKIDLSIVWMVQKSAVQSKSSGAKITVLI